MYLLKLGLILTVPVGDVLICDTGCDIKHDDTALAVNIVSITKPSELLLPCSIPDIELDFTQILQRSVAFGDLGEAG